MYNVNYKKYVCWHIHGVINLFKSMIVTEVYKIIFTCIIWTWGCIWEEGNEYTKINKSSQDEYGHPTNLLDDEPKADRG